MHALPPRYRPGGGGRGMNLTEALRFAWRGVTANKARSLLTMLGVLIGVASVIALTAVGNGASATVTNTLNSLGSNTLTVVPSNAPRRERVRRSRFSGAGGGAQSGHLHHAPVRTPAPTSARSTLTLADAEALADQTQAPDVLGVAPVVTVRRRRPRRITARPTPSPR